MGDLSESLSRYEFKCPCGCNIDTVDYELVEVLQDLVDHFQGVYTNYNVGIHINSGNRCKEYNTTINNASPTSKHTEYRAADFFLYNKKSGNYIKGTKIPPESVAKYLEHKYTNKFGIGRYDNRTHLDTRTIKARWDNRERR